MSSVSGHADLRTNFRRDWQFSNLWASTIEFWTSCGNTSTSSVLKTNCAPTKYTVTAKAAETQLGQPDNNCRGEVLQPSCKVTNTTTTVPRSTFRFLQSIKDIIVWESFSHGDMSRINIFCTNCIINFYKLDILHSRC